MKKFLAALLLVTLASPAYAAGRCYSLDEVNAEKVIRMHSELMVITVTCKQSSTGRDLVRAYTGFTKQNINLIRQSEQTLSKYYAASYGGDGISRLDTLRTKLANEYGQQVADLSAPAFCAQRRDKVISMFDSPPRSLQEDSMRTYASDKTYEAVCDKSLKVADTDSSAGSLADDEAKEPAPKAKKIKKKVKS